MRAEDVKVGMRVMNDNATGVVLSTNLDRAWVRWDLGAYGTVEIGAIDPEPPAPAKPVRVRLWIDKITGAVACSESDHDFSDKNHGPYEIADVRTAGEAEKRLADLQAWLMGNMKRAEIVNGNDRDLVQAHEDDLTLIVELEAENKKLILALSDAAGKVEGLGTEVKRLHNILSRKWESHGDVPLDFNPHTYNIGRAVEAGYAITDGVFGRAKWYAPRDNNVNWCGSRAEAASAMVAHFLASKGEQPKPVEDLMTRAVRMMAESKAAESATVTVQLKQGGRMEPLPFPSDPPFRQDAMSHAGPSEAVAAPAFHDVAEFYKDDDTNPNDADDLDLGRAMRAGYSITHDISNGSLWAEPDGSWKGIRLRDDQLFSAILTHYRANKAKP